MRLRDWQGGAPAQANLFRSLPLRRGSETDSWDPDEEVASMEPTWPHLQIVYELLLRFVVCQDTDAKAAKKCAPQQRK